MEQATEPAAGISLDELQLAARNHAMPLEVLRQPLTPTGLHYLLIHYDIPAVDTATWRLELGGLVERPLSLSLEDLRARPAVDLTVTMECAGNGRARLEPRPIAMPWLGEAVGTARWSGVRVREDPATPCRPAGPWAPSVFPPVWISLCRWPAFSLSRRNRARRFRAGARGLFRLP